MKSLRAALFLLAIACCALIGGCSHPRSAEAESVTTIRFWNGFTGPDGKTMERMVADFQKKHPEIRVQMQVIPWAQYYDKLTLGLAFNSAPDLFVCPAHRLAEYAHYKAFRPLDDFLDGPQGLPREDFLPAPWAAGQFEGRTYGVPLDCFPLGLYYNKDHFRKAGIVDSSGDPKPPKTWEEFLDAGRKLTIDKNGDGRPDQWGFSITNRYSNWVTFVRQHGGAPLTPDLRHGALTTPEVLEGTRKLRSLITEHKVAPPPNELDSWMGFRQGKLSMVMEGIYMLADLKKSEGLDYGGAPVPAFGPIRATWGGSHLLCMPKDVPERQAAAAWTLIKYLSDNSIEWADGGQVPVRRSVQSLPRFQTMPVQVAFGSQLPYVMFDPPSVKITEISPFLERAVEVALLGLATPEAAMADGNERVNRVLARP